MAEFGWLLWVRWREFRATAVYWLRVIGYEPGRAFTQRVYGFYVLLLIGAVAFVIWLEAADICTRAGVALAAVPGAQHALQAAVPAVIAGIQVVLMMVAASSSPFKLTLPEIAYVAGSPAPRPAAVAASLVQTAIGRLLAAAALISLLSIVLTGGEAAAATAPLVVLPVALLSISLAWIAGLGRLALPGLRPWRGVLWAVPLVAGVAAFAVPAVGEWPGRVLKATIVGGALPAALPWLAALALAATAGAVALGRRVSLIDVADESDLYARLAAVRALAWIDPSLLQKVRVEASAARRRPRGRLPAASGPGVLVARAALGFARRPGRLLGLSRDLFVVLGGAFVLVTPGASYPWLAWLFASCFFPPTSLGGGFAADNAEPFVRQFLPFDDLRLLLADAALPTAAIALVGVLAWLGTHRFGHGAILGALFVPALLALRLAAHGVSSARSVRGRFRPPFILVALITFGLVGLIGAPARAPWVALALCGLFALGLGRILGPFAIRR